MQSKRENDGNYEKKEKDIGVLADENETRWGEPKKQKKNSLC